MRRVLPPVILVLLALVCLVVLGLACACASDHPVHAVERAVAHPPVAVVPGDVWTLGESTLLGTALLVAWLRGRRPAAAPVLLERLLL